MTKHVIAEAALAQHIAILGKTGSGKTTTGKLCIEQVVAEGSRVCVLDPIKSDWWGLTSSADGKRAGLPFHILGGPRGHVSLHANAGKAIGEIVANGALPLSILDMADFAPGGQAHFFVDFAPMLIRKMRGVVYLVIEEAHLFAPKERSGVGKENLSIHWAKTLATAGRSKGIRLVLITQRTQALHNALLGSCDTMIAHRMTAPADQEPVVKWLKANVKDAALREKVAGSLSSLPTGSGWLCSGEAKLFELVKFPRASTYDNTATPDGNTDAQEVKTAPVDPDKLRAIIGNAVAEAEANDPAKLRQEIASLKRQLSSAPVKTPVSTGAKYTAEDLKAAEQRVFQQGYRDGSRETAAYYAEHVRHMRARAHNALKEALTDIEPPKTGPVIWSQPSAKPAQNIQKIFTAPTPTARAVKHESNGSVPPSVRKILDVIHRSYPVSLSFDAAARRAAISSRSSAYRSYRAAVAASDELEEAEGKYRSRPEFAATAPVSSASSLSEWVGKLPSSYGKMLAAIHEHGPIDKEQIADLAGVSKTSSGLGSGLRELQSLQLVVERDGRYEVEEGLR